MANELKPFDTAAHLTEEADQVSLLADAAASGDAAVIAAAIGIVARARGMADLAAQTSMSRQQLYRTLGPTGNPTLATLMRILDVLGLELKIEPRRAA